MEAIGLALSIYPAAILAFEQFKVGAKYFKNWAQFRRQYERRIHDIEAQQFTFEELLFNLMCCGRDPYLKSADDKTAFLDIVSHESYRGWKDPRLKRNLEMRLGNKYDWFLFTINRICELLREISEELEVVNSFETSDKTPDWWRFQWERIKKTLFAEEYEENYKEVERLNEDLQKVLELHDKNQALRATGSTSIATFFKTVQENARRLYKVLANSWHCHCDVAHKTLLLLEPRLEARGSQFCLIFFLPQQQLANNGNGSHKGIEREVHVEILDSNTEKDPTTMPVISKALVLETPANDKFREQRALQENIAMRKLVAGSKLWGFTSKFRKREKTITSITRNQPISPILLKTQQDLIPTADKKPQVTFSQEPPITQTISQNLPPISELCMAMQNPTTKSCLGYLHDESKTQYQLYLHNPHAAQKYNTDTTTSTTTLKELLEGDHKKFPRQKRLLVAATLASSLAQLQRTHWLPNRWGKGDIIFNKRNQSVIFEKPYIATQFLSTPTPTSDNTDSKYKYTDDAKPSEERDLKTLLESLGIVLIELCLGEPIENSSDRVQLHPYGGRPNHDFCLAIANAWTSEELRDEGPEFVSPIDHCLHFPTIGRVSYGGYQEVLRDIYLVIAKPLQDEIVRIQERSDGGWR